MSGTTAGSPTANSCRLAAVALHAARGRSRRRTKTDVGSAESVQLVRVVTQLGALVSSAPLPQVLST